LVHLFAWARPISPKRGAVAMPDARWQQLALLGWLAGRKPRSIAVCANEYRVSRAAQPWAAMFSGLSHGK
jgi:hypothetical protein